VRRREVAADAIRRSIVPQFVLTPPAILSLAGSRRTMREPSSTMAGGTESSNPVSSSGESTNFRFL
jgi:hypothetical protein